jgi:multiple sugar transport system substrate-binding protein
VPPAAAPEPITPKPSPSLVVREGERLSMLVTGSASLAADEQLRALAAEWGRLNGIEVAIETVSAATVRSRLATPQGTDGLDIVQCRDNLAWLSGDLFADLSVEADALAGAFGGYYDAPAMQARIAGSWKALPFSVVPSAVIYRSDWLKAAGAATFPATAADLLTVGKALKAGGHPFGASAGRSAEDPRALWYSVLWSFGGRVTEDDGKTIAINSPETITALEWARQFWADACLPEGLAWDDNGNNLAYTNAQIAATQNSPSLYLTLRDTRPDLAARSDLALLPAGPAGQAVPVTTYAHAVLKSSPNGDAARAFLSWLGQRAQTDRYLDAAGGALVAALRAYEDSPVWSRDPKLRAFLAAASVGRWVGWPAPPSRAAADADSRFVVVDMFARVFAGKNPQVSIAEAEAALKGIFTS